MFRISTGDFEHVAAEARVHEVSAQEVCDVVNALRQRGYVFCHGGEWSATEAGMKSIFGGVYAYERAASRKRAEARNEQEAARQRAAFDEATKTSFKD
jgi:hypothetical protein